MNPRDLRPLASFSGISDQGERSRALFNEIAKVVTHPRCMNCHPAGNHPLQGNDRHEHLPPVPRGDAGLGVAGLNCATCHTERNFTLVGATTYKSIPGHPRWQLAPIEMAWEGKIDRPDLPAAQGPGAQWRPHARAAAGASRQGRSGRVGLGAGRRPRARAGQSAAARRARAGLDRQRRAVSVAGFCHPGRAISASRVCDAHGESRDP